MKLFNILSTSIDSFDQTIESYLQKAFGSIGKKLSQSSIYNIVFQGIKGVMANMMFYIEDVLNEQNIFTASRKKSIYSLSKISGYEPFYGSPATGTLIAKLQLNNGLPSKTSKIILYNNTSIINKNTNINYSLVLPTGKFIFDISDPLFIKEFKIVQGYYVTASHVATGASLETVHIQSQELFDINSISVNVDGEEYERVGTIYDMTDRAKQYVVNIGYDNSFDVIFGNESYGKKLNEGQTVFIKYLKHIGKLGNIEVNDSSKFIFSGTGYDMYGNPVDLNDYMKLTVKNVISGGLNSDSIDFIRTNIGLNSRSSVIVSEDNFKLFLKRFSFIGYSNIYVDANTTNVYCVAIRNIEKMIKNTESYYNMTPSNFLLYDEEKTMIKTTLYNSRKMFSGLTFNFIDPIFRRYAIICYVKAENTYEHDIISAQIKKILSDYFIKSIINTSFIAKSTLTKLLVDNIEEMQSIELTIISEYEETAYHDKVYDIYTTDDTLDANNIIYKTHRMIWDNMVHPGLDEFGNILLNSKLEMPLLNGPIKYYPNKNSNKKQGSEDSISVNAVEVYFV